MKLKKLFTGLVALALAATMAAPALAASPAAPDKDNLFGIKTTIIGGTGFGSEKLKLELLDEGKPFQVENSSLTVAEAASLKISIPDAEKDGVEIVQGTGANDKNKDSYSEGMLHIQLPTYTKVGTYTYKFKLAEGNTAGMIYNDTTKYLKVFVYEDVEADGSLKENASLKVKAVLLGSNEMNDNTDDYIGEDPEKFTKIDAIKNSYYIHKVWATKEVKGNAGDRDKEFGFKIILTIPNGKSISENTVIYKQMVKVDKKSEKIIDYLEESKSEFDINSFEKNGNVLSYSFKLKHDQTMVLEQIPYDVTIKVVELDANGNEITTPIDGKYMNGEYEVIYDERGNKENPIDRNTCTIKTRIINKSTMNPDTGIILDNAPYIALLTIVAAGTVMMLIKKRRIED